MSVVTIHDFNPDGETANITSPRSLEACEATGILPDELVRKDLSYFKNEARLAKGIEATEAFVKEKHQHFERNREKKVQMVERMRQKMIDEARERVETEGPTAEEKMSTLVANEKRNVEKQRERQKKELQNMLAFELRRQQIEEENRKKAEEEARKEEAMRKERLIKEKEWEEHQRQMVLEKMRKQIEAEELARIKAIEIAEENARQEAEALEKERRQKAAIEEKNRIAREIRQKKRAAAEKRNREIQDELIAKREEMERQEELRREKLEQQRLEAAEETRRILTEKQAKFRATQEMNKNLLEEKRVMYMQKEQAAEERYIAFQEAQAKEWEKNLVKAARRAEQLKAVKAKSDAILQAEIQRALDRERAVNERLAERARNQEERNRIKKEEDMEKERIRQAMYDKAKEQERERVLNIERRRAEDEQRREQAEAERLERLAWKQAQEKLLQQDRKEHAIRMARVKEYEKKKLMDRIQNDTLRVEDMHDQKLQLQEQRRRMRDDGAMQKAQIMEKFDVIKNSVNIEDLKKDGANGETGECTIDLSKFGLNVDMTLSINLNALTQKAEVPRLGKKKSHKKKFSATTTELKPLTLPNNDRPKTSQSQKAKAASPTALKKPKPMPMPAMTRVTPTKPKPKQAPEDSGSDSDADPIQRDRSRGAPPPSRLPAAGRNPRGGGLGRSASSKTLPPYAQRMVGRKKKRGMQNSRSTSGLRGHGRNQPRRVRPMYPVMSKVDAEAIVEELAASQNAYLLMLLTRERANEAERERIYQEADEAQREKLDKIFGLERAKASQIIKSISHDHEVAIMNKMSELGLLA